MAVVGLQGLNRKTSLGGTVRSTAHTQTWCSPDINSRRFCVRSSPGFVSSGLSADPVFHSERQIIGK
jgi:hypothetical protein